MNELEPFDLSQEVVEIATDRLAENIVLLDLQEQAILTDYFVLMTCNSARHTEALAYDLDENYEKAIEIYKKIEMSNFKEKKYYLIIWLSVI